MSHGIRVVTGAHCRGYRYAFLGVVCVMQYEIGIVGSKFLFYDVIEIFSGNGKLNRNDFVTLDVDADRGAVPGIIHSYVLNAQGIRVVVGDHRRRDVHEFVGVVFIGDENSRVGKVQRFAYVIFRFRS